MSQPADPPPTSWPLAQAVNEAHVGGPVWSMSQHHHRWWANQCRTHLGPLAGVCDLRVERRRQAGWVGSAYLWPDPGGAVMRSVTVRPEKAPDWTSAAEAKAAMEDLLHWRPGAERLRVGPAA